MENMLYLLMVVHWYPEACNFLQVKRIAYHLEKSLMERVTQYLRTESRV